MSDTMRAKGPEDEAAAWRARLTSGSISDAERRRFETWMSTPANAEAYGRLENVETILQAEGEALLAAEFERQLTEEAQVSASATRRRVVQGAIAAAAIGVAAPLAWMLSPKTAQYATQRGERASFSLADGSRLTLNTATRLVMRWTRSRRSASLEQGEALFDVAREARPFAVATPHLAIAVTGTVFSVFADEKRTRVAVISGSVDVAAGETTHTLVAGDSVDAYADGSMSNVLPFDPDLILAWRNGKARYRATPLAAVVDDLNRYYPATMVLAADRKKDAPVTGEFDIRDQAAAVSALAVAFALTAEKKDGVIVLRDDGP